MNNPDLKFLHRAIDSKLQDIASLIVKGCRIKLIIRNPNTADGDILLTDEPNVDDAIFAINKMKNRNPLK